MNNVRDKNVRDKSVKQGALLLSHLLITSLTSKHSYMETKRSINSMSPNKHASNGMPRDSHEEYRT